MTDLPPLIEEPKILLTHEDFAAFSARMKRLQIGLDDFSGRMASLLESARDLARLPKTGAIWPEAERKLWLDLLSGSFKLIYKDDDKRAMLGQTYDHVREKTRPPTQTASIQGNYECRIIKLRRCGRRWILLHATELVCFSLPQSFHSNLSSTRLDILWSQKDG